jgi:hypothetical protein
VKNTVGIIGAERPDLGDLISGGGMQQVRGPLTGVNLIRLP